MLFSGRSCEVIEGQWEVMGIQWEVVGGQWEVMGVQWEVMVGPWPVECHGRSVTGHVVQWEVM